MQQIHKNIFIENSFLGVTLGGLVFPHGCIMIDAPLRAEDARAWRSMLFAQRSGGSRLLINLDAHPDRTLGARAMDCPILAHQKAANLFRNRPAVFKGQTVETGAAWEDYGDSVGMRWGTPDLTFTHTMSFNWGGAEILLESHAGPSQGAIWVIIPDEKVVFVGDAVVLGQPPFLAGADIVDWLDSLDTLLSTYRDYTIISGRGGLAPTQSILAQHALLKNTLRGFERLAKRSASADATEDLIPGLMADYKFSPGLEQKYLQRLRHGLYQYYARRYRPASSLDPNRVEDGEQ